MIDDELNPEWDDEKVIVGVNPDETPGGSTDMVIAVWDSDGPLLKGDFLGQVKIPRETLLFPAEPGATVTYELESREGLTEKQESLVQGRIAIKITPRPSLNGYDDDGGADASVQVPVQIMSAAGLACADFSFTGKGASDPFCEVRWNGDIVHKTKVIDNNLDPEWEEEKFTVGVSPHDTAAEMLIAVWDSDGPLLKGDFLGQVVIPGSALLEPTEQTVTYQLEQKEGLTAKKVSGKVAVLGAHAYIHACTHVYMYAYVRAHTCT